MVSLTMKTPDVVQEELAERVNGKGSDISEAAFLSAGAVGGVTPRKGREISQQVIAA